jgi:hypothetical protein
MTSPEARAARAAGDLHEQRGQALGGEKAALYSAVRAQHADQREARESWPLGQHLRRPDVERVRFHPIAHVREGMLRARAVGSTRAMRVDGNAAAAPLRSQAQRNRSTLPHEGQARGNGSTWPQ